MGGRQGYRRVARIGHLEIRPVSHGSGTARCAARGGVCEVAARGSVYYPPIGVLARVLAGPDQALGRLTTVGAAFIGVSGTKKT